MKLIRAYSFKAEQYHAYSVPTIHETVEHSNATWGKQYDPVERRVIEGGLPLLWERAKPKVVA